MPSSRFFIIWFVIALIAFPSLIKWPIFCNSFLNALITLFLVTFLTSVILRISRGRHEGGKRADIPKWLQIPVDAIFGAITLAAIPFLLINLFSGGVGACSEVAVIQFKDKDTKQSIIGLKGDEKKCEKWYSLNLNI
ncbi:MAG: hypothetical protein IEMM0008_0594 [bacterium]|nr:MAG: hypothetical protein IEMM0008_0594 [bacterium]